MNIKQFMARNESEFRKFERVRNPPSPHPDLCAMLILSKFMANPHHSIINTASDRKPCSLPVIVFDPSIKDVEATATEGQIIDLIRCGVYYNSEYHALVMDI